MKKEKKIFTGICVVLICLSFGLVAYLEFVYAKPSYDWEDDYYSVRFHKNYTVLKVPSDLVDGEQYEFIMVDKFLPRYVEDRHYGVLQVNESTGLIEFRVWKHSNNTFVKIIPTNESINISDYDIWVHFGIKPDD